MKETRPQARPAASGVTRVFMLQHASAPETADILTDILDVSRSATATQTLNQRLGACVYPLAVVGPPPRHLDQPRCSTERPLFVADLRTNSLFVRLPAEEADDMERIAELIRRLDTDLVEAR